MEIVNLDWTSINEGLPGKGKHQGYYDVWICYKDDTIAQTYGFTKGVYDCNSQSFSLENKGGLYFKKDNFRNHVFSIQIMAWMPILNISENILSQFYK